MANKKWWFNLVKNLFTCESTSKAEKGKPKGRKWFFDKFRFKQLPTLTPQEKSLSKAKEEQRKHALNVAKVTTVAAEAAMAAAQAAVEVVRLTLASQSIRLDKEARNLAAIRIQAAFRGYVARSALRALKGMVRLQALARGNAVRRQMIKELEHSRSIRRSQVQTHSHKLHRKNHSEGSETGERFLSPRMSNEMFDLSKLESKSQRQWSESLFSKSMFLKRHEVAMKREHLKQYSFSHRERRSHDLRVEETMPLWHKGGHNWQRKKWCEENTPLDFHTSTRICDHGGNFKLRARNLLKEEFLEELSPSSSYPRRSFCQMKVKPSVVDEDCHDQLTSSPIFPTYMAATESAKARMRSMSTPRQRGRYDNPCFDYESPYKSFRVYPWSSTNDDSKTGTFLWLN